MSARTVGLILALVAVLAAAGATWLFTVQNSARRVMLSLNLGLTRFALAEPVPVPVLMGICLGVGLLVGVVLLGIPYLRAAGRARRAERRAALSTTTEGLATADRGEDRW
jgi:uncharacterized membrane protein YciS (DUF1049 family)